MYLLNNHEEEFVAPPTKAEEAYLDKVSCVNCTACSQGRCVKLDRPVSPENKCLKYVDESILMIDEVA